MAASPTVNLTFQNFFSATLTADISASATDIPLDNIPNGSEGFLVIDPDTPASREIIYYTSKTAVKVVCPSAADGRGQDDTSATSHTQGTLVIMAPIAAYYETLLALFQTSPQGWTGLGASVSSVSYNGNRSYSLSVSSDLTASVSNGMRLRTTRTVTAPTQCTSLNGSTQYYSKSSPAGMTFTDDFVVSGWFKPTSYGSGAQILMSRYNGTSGWALILSASGQVQLLGFNAGSANFKGVQSYQSVALNKWVHIAAQVDMNTATLTSTTNYVMLDGVDVPASIAQGGTNPTTLIQAGNLEVGSWNGGLLPFSGKIAQAAVFNAKVTQATMRGYISQGLSGSETSLISAYSFNNSINDLNTTNANNLTASGSAVATNADSPFTQNAAGTPGGTYDYGIVTGISASTITVQVPEGCAIPTSGGVSAASYSTYRAPFGFPAQRGKWVVEWLQTQSNNAQSGVALGTWLNVNNCAVLNVPVGEWSLGYNGVFRMDSSSTTLEQAAGIGTSSSTVISESISDHFNGASSTIIVNNLSKQINVSVPTAASYYLNQKAVTAGGTIVLYSCASAGSTVFRAELGYL